MCILNWSEFPKTIGPTGKTCEKHSAYQSEWLIEFRLIEIFGFRKLCLNIGIVWYMYASLWCCSISNTLICIIIKNIVVSQELNFQLMCTLHSNLFRRLIANILWLNLQQEAIAHLRKQFKSINTYDYHNAD